MEGGFYMPALRNLSDRYREIAEQEKIFFADPFRWDISMAYDGIHFFGRRTPNIHGTNS